MSSSTNPSSKAASQPSRAASKSSGRKSPSPKPPKNLQPDGAPKSTEPADSAASSQRLSLVLDGEARAVVIAIPASPEFVRVVRLAVAGVATRMRFSYEQIEDIKLAVSEACNNAILHATPPGGGAATQVVIRMLPGEESLEITVFDQGHLPVGSLELPSGSRGKWQSLDDLPEGGMGLMLIQSLMDEVSSRAGAPEHTALHMVKRIHPL